MVIDSGGIGGMDERRLRAGGAPDGDLQPGEAAPGPGPAPTPGPTPSPPAPGGSLDDAVEVFQRLRSRLFGIAYRVLGSVSEAEDVVQEAWVRWQGADRAAVLDPGAFLAKATTRLAINVAQSARVRREAYVGPWLPEPVDTSVDPQVGAERGEAVELAVLLVLQKLNPVERAAYVLREAFDYPYDDIAGMLQVTRANTRQIVSRARKRLSAERRDPVDTAEHRRLLEAFVAAARHGDVAALEGVLSADVVAYADGNGMRGVARLEVTGAGRVARISAFARKFFPGAEYDVVEANGRPSLRLVRDGATVALMSATVGPDGIDGLYWILTPAKLRAYERSAHRVTGRRP
ncbi:sigma factor-like helix-turn-helix DNA-binding protein [Streptomyces sp. JV178]|uniref:sigma factor-like helix-turn-helix DNA-binding protein n=1 Tax=Streptomyces sp. JV178 TaxID=858632 RepID=UPI00211DC0D0|nr:sigma factor-like helix-turn-helix DNA-binding protein [Streptomyces sp. JV178]